MFGFLSLPGAPPQQDNIVTQKNSDLYPVCDNGVYLTIDGAVVHKGTPVVTPDSDWSIVYQIGILLCVLPACSVCGAPEQIGWTLRGQLNLPVSSQTFLLVKLKSRCV